MEYFFKLRERIRSMAGLLAEAHYLAAIMSGAQEGDVRRSDWENLMEKIRVVLDGVEGY